MNTALATQNNKIMSGTTDEQSLILPNNKREALLMKLNEFKVSNLSARDLRGYQALMRLSTSFFIRLCWEKFGVSQEQLQRLDQHDINELAEMIHQESRTKALIHTGILACIPVIGWVILLISLNTMEYADPDLWTNMRYYWWYKRIKNKYGRDFKPTV